MKKFFVFIVLTCLLGNRALAQTRSASNTSFTHEVYDFSNIEATTTTVWSGYQEFGSFSQTRFDIANTQFNVSEGDIIRVSFSPANNNTPGTGGGPEGRFKPYQGWSELIAVNNIRYGNGYYEATITGTATVNGNTVNVVDYINNNGLGIQAAYMTITSVQVISMGSLTWNGNNLVAFAGNSLPKRDRISVDNTSGYSIGISDANSCSYLQSTTQGRLFYINNLNVGDVVRIWCAGECRILTDNTATHDSNNPLVWNFNDPDPSWNGQQQAPWGGQMYYDREINNRDGVQLQETSNYDVSNPSPTANELKIVNNHDNGTLVIRLANQYAGIIKVEIDAVQTTPRYDYDASLEVYDMYETRDNNGAYTADESAEFKLNNKYGYYLKFTNNDLSLNERIAIDNTNTWTFAHGIQAPSNWSNLSICNLREGDRVLIYYTGDAPIFSSNGNNGDYTGNAAFKDTWNDGMLDTNEGDHIITKGDPVEYTYCRKEGTFGNEEGTNHIWLYTSYPYVMMENGHLDLSLSNGNHTRIVKVKIYSDHQAMMVDDYDNETYTYTAYFNITGELQAKEHIVPGGLEVHVGNDNADQHANVVFSKEGPVSYVKAVDGYKIPGIYRDTNGQIHNNFNLANEAPTTGTYYRFIPEANGQMTIRFKATSLNYYRWDLKADDIYYNTDTGGGWTTEFDRSNEWPMDRSCPYYLMVQDGDSYTSASFKIDDSSNSSTGAFKKKNEYVTLTLDVQAGKTYYLYGTWDQQKGNGDDNSIGGTDANLSERPACGIAELLWVKFNPENKVYPLAKWVPNDTKAVNENNKVPNPDDPSVMEGELAIVKGYVGATITVKKMSGNIIACRPYIQRASDDATEGKLMIDGIQFAKDKNPGGTILIKIGNPDSKTAPLYALTIAYSTDPKYNGENGLTGDDGRGHTWDLTTNSLYGMKWDLTDDAYVKSQAPQYSTTFETSTGGYATPTPYGTYFKDYYANEASIANFTEEEDVWDYFHNLPNGINTGSLLEEEIDYNDHHGISRSDWSFGYNLVYGDKLFDPVFKNKYDMEGDNADMIWDTEGTVIRTSANQSVIFNEFTGDDIHSSEKDPNRYVGIIEGGEFRIPWLMKDDRVIIWMGTGHGRYADEVNFNIRGAYDAVHNEISESDDYIVGGSHWDGADGDKNYRGCYHFFATGDKNNAGKPADMVFKMKEGSLCKIYKIQIYRGDRIITNDLVPVGDSPLYLLTEKGSEETIEGTYSIQYRGKGESISEPEMAGMTGNLAASDATLASLNDDNTSVKFTSTLKDKFGVFNMRLNDMERNNKYVADFADRNFPVDYYEGMSHPYTWDFTDVNRFNTSYLASENSKYSADDLNIWDAEKNFTWKRNDELLFVPGGQIYADARMIAEAAGIQFTPINIGSGTIKATNDGLRIEGGDLNENDINALTVPNIDGGSYDIGSDQQKAIWEDPSGSPERTGWKLTIPNLPNLTAAYIRVQTIEGKDPKLTFDFSRGSGTVGSWSFFKKTINNNDGTKDIIVGLSPSLGGSDMAYNIFLNNVIVKKIATSKDIKPAFGPTGYQTESRHREIDHRLTSFFTGEDIEAFYGTLGTNENGEQVVVLHHLDIMDKADPEYSGDGIIVPEGSTYKEVYEGTYEDKEGKGCILYHSTGVYVEKDKRYDRSFGILDGGFHLFVPDMHDMDATKGEDDLGGPDDISSNILWARFYNADTWLSFTPFTPGLAEKSGNSINFGLSASHYNRSDEIEKGNGYDVGFYHVASKGARMATHSAYLRMPTAVQSKIFFACDGDLFIEDNGIATQIDSASENAKSTQKGAYYTLSGVKVNKPEKKGLYIQNGKKVIVK